MILALIAFILLSVSHAEIIFPVADELKSEKLAALKEIDLIMPNGGAAGVVVRSDKLFLWTNSVPAKLVDVNSTAETYDVPLVITASAQNESILREHMQKICECDLSQKQIGGIIIASTRRAANMFFKEGWSGHKSNELDGIVPPIVIIYHEMSHASDFIKDPAYFLDLAAQSDKQWKNKAEKSAVEQQNDFAITVAVKMNKQIARRRSYGKNTLFAVEDFWSITPLIVHSEK